jgi:hypothetical protein
VTGVEPASASDTEPPVIHSATLTPGDFGNTVHLAQELSVRITDGESGVDPASIEFTLIDETAEDSDVYVADSYSTASGCAVWDSESWRSNEVDVVISSVV